MTGRSASSPTPFGKADMSAHDRYLMAHSKHHVRVECRDCGHAWDDFEVSEYGAAWLESHEDCPSCGSTELDVSELDELDIQERILEARGEDF